MINVYMLSGQVTGHDFVNETNSRIQAFLGSKYSAGQSPNSLCRNIGPKQCHWGALYCHNTPPESMLEYGAATEGFAELNIRT